jgi:hypothetical protein
MSERESATNGPQDGPQVIEYLFSFVEEGAKGLTLDPSCRTLFHSAPDPTGLNNDGSFQQCFDKKGWPNAQKKLEQVATFHGMIAKFINGLVAPSSDTISSTVFIAAGKAMRHICTVSCDGTTGVKGQWCTWP